MLTDKLFTGQREITGLGIYYYRARFYSSYINRFLSADTIVPGYANPQNLNRYSYVNNNPLRYTDPTGHMQIEDEGSTKGGLDCRKFKQYCNNGKKKTNKELQDMAPKPVKQPKNVVIPPVNLQVAVPTATATLPSDLQVTLPAQPCTSGFPCIGNFLPSATPSPTSTPLPLMSSEDAKDLTQYWVPSNPLSPNFAPNIDDLWNRLGTTLPPLFNIPAINSNIIVNRIVDGATNAARTANNVLVNYSAYIISGGISPILPIVPYAPSVDPFATVYQ